MAIAWRLFSRLVHGAKYFQIVAPQKMCIVMYECCIQKLANYLKRNFKIASMYDFKLCVDDVKTFTLLFV